MTVTTLNKRGKELSHFTKFLLGLDLPKTQTTIAEQNALAKYSSGRKVAVEIGVFEGFNTLNIARSLSDDGVLYAIDPFIKGNLGVCYGELICKNYLKRNNLLAKAKFIRKFSFEAATDVVEPIDLIFIDGDHSYEGMEQDWKLWSVKVKAGGIIALHDTNYYGQNEHVKKLGSWKYYNEVIQYANDFKLIDTVDSMNVLVRLK